MNIQINTKTKSIIILEAINIIEFIDELSLILPDYREYKILANTLGYTQIGNFGGSRSTPDWVSNTSIQAP